VNVCFVGFTKAAVHMLGKMNISLLESIPVNELCEFNGRQNLAGTKVRITPLVRTISVDAIPQRSFLGSNI